MADVFKEGQKTAVVAGTATVLFAAAKAAVGFVSGSVVLLADAIHSAADSFSTFFAWFGLKISRKKPTERFPYGFYKAENIASLVISGLILFAGYEIIKEAVAKVFTEYQLNIPLAAISVAVLDAAVMFLIGSYEVKAGKKINSQSLVADGKESKMHVFSSSMVVMGVVSGWLGIPYLEGAMGVLISLFVFKIGIETAKDSVFALMDVSPSRETEKKIEKILGSISGVRGFSDLKLRKSGPFVFGEVRARIGKDVSVNRAREISDSIEREVKKKVKEADSFIVAVSPYRTERQKICVPVKENRGLDSEISDHFGRAENFVFAETDGGRIESFYVKKNPFREKEIRAGLEVSSFVLQEKIDSVITGEMGPISFHALRDNIVDVYHRAGGTAKEAILRFFEKKVEPLKEPTREKK